MFPNAWPGKGLLLLRVIVASILIRDGVVACALQGDAGSTPLRALAAILGLLFLAGLWTPLVAISITVLELTEIALGIGEVRVPLVLMGICLAVSMLGPGVWSVDSVLYGRKRLKLQDR